MAKNLVSSAHKKSVALLRGSQCCGLGNHCGRNGADPPGLAGWNQSIGSRRRLHAVAVSASAPTQEELYDPRYNPHGIVNLGTGTNYLMQNEVKSRIDRLRLEQLDLGTLNPESVERDLSRAVAGFMTKYFQSNRMIRPDEVKILHNVTAGIDLLGTYLGQPQDVILCPAPGYSRLFRGCTQYSALEVVPVYLKHNQERKKYFCLNTSVLEEAIVEQMDMGKHVTGMLLTNPNNPSGEIYGEDLLLEIMSLCQRYDLHLIVSEVYCLSVFGKGSQFHSVLKLGSKIPDPDRTHVLWGLTKDLCLTGLYAAVLHSKNEALMSKVHLNNLFPSVLVPEQQLLATCLNDHDWISNKFIVANHERMSRAFDRAKHKIESLGVEVFPSEAGFFLFCNFKNILHPNTKENSIEIFKRFQDNRVYVVPYWEMRCCEPGWFRIVFTAEDHIFDEGFERIKRTVEEWRTAFPRD